MWVGVDGLKGQRWRIETSTAHHTDRFCSPPKIWEVRLGKADIVAGLKTIVGLTNYESENIYAFILSNDLVGERTEKQKSERPDFSDDQSRRVIALGVSYLKFRPGGKIHDRVWAEVIPDARSSLASLGYSQEMVEGIKYPEFLQKVK